MVHRRRGSFGAIVAFVRASGDALLSCSIEDRRERRWLLLVQLTRLSRRRQGRQTTTKKVERGFLACWLAGLWSGPVHAATQTSLASSPAFVWGSARGPDWLGLNVYPSSSCAAARARAFAAGSSGSSWLARRLRPTTAGFAACCRRRHPPFTFFPRAAAPDAHSHEPSTAGQRRAIPGLGRVSSAATTAAVTLHICTVRTCA